MTKDTKTVGTLQGVYASSMADPMKPQQFIATPNYMDGEWHDWASIWLPVYSDVKVDAIAKEDDKILEYTNHVARNIPWHLVYRFRVVQTNAEAPNSPVGGDEAVEAPRAYPDPQMGAYGRRVRSEVIDIYDVLTAWNVTNAAVAHAIKKALQPGQRGHKDTITDLREAMASLQRAIEIEEGKE